VFVLILKQAQDLFNGWCLTPDRIAKMASASALDRTAAQKAVSAAVPAILSGLANLAASREGAQRLSSVIAEQPRDTLASYAEMSKPATRLQDAGKNTLSTLLGVGALDTLASSVGKFAGIDDGSSRSMVGMLVPLVLGILGRQQREGGLTASELATTLASQRDEFNAAMPAALSQYLQRSGYLNRTTGTDRRTASTSSVPTRWVYWALPLAALAGLAWSFLSGDWSQPDQAGNTAGAIKSTDQAMHAASVASETDIGRQLNEAMNSLQRSLTGVRDADSGAALLPKLRDVSAQIDRLTEMVDRLPAEARTRLTGSLTCRIPAIADSNSN
jgi:hypothetical protein